MDMKRLKNNIGNYIAYGIFLVMNIVLNVALGESYIDDATFAQGVSQFGSLIRFAWYYYNNWSGRIIPHSLLVILLNFPHAVIVVLNALALTALVILLSRVCAMGIRISEKWRLILAAGVQVLVVTLVGRSILVDAVTWITASVLYVWGMAAGIVALLPFFGKLYGEEITGWKWIVCLFCGLYASNVEQVAAFTVASAFILGCVSMWLERKETKKPLLWLADGRLVSIFAVVLCGMAVSLAAPGNRVREAEDILIAYPDYDMRTFPEKVLKGFESGVQVMNDSCVLLCLICALLTCLLVWINSRWLLARLAGCFAVLYYLCAFILGLVKGLGSDLTIKALEVLRKTFYNYQVIHDVDFLVDSNQVISLLVAMFAFWLMVCLIFLYSGWGCKQHSNEACENGLDWPGFLMFGGAFGTVYMLSFSPAGFASGMRSYFLMKLLLIGAIVRLATFLVCRVRDVRDERKNPGMD